MSMVCSLNGDGGQPTSNNSNTNTNPNTNTNTNTNANANPNANANAANTNSNTNAMAYDYGQQQSSADVPNASTPLLLGHESGGAASGDVGNSGTAITVLQPPAMIGTAGYATTTAESAALAAAAAPTGETMLSLNSGTLSVSGGMVLPGTLNFVMGAASAQTSNNDNNNNMDNASDDSNPVTIYRCRAPIASLDCMEEFSGTGGHLDFGRSISLGSNPALPLRHGSTPTPGLRYKNLGKSGLRISNVGLGTWPVFSPGVSDEQAESILKLAIDSGINLFDISEAHSETEIGKILQRTGWKRTTYVITTKVYWSTKSEERGLSRKHIIECVRASLQRLQLNYIDIVIIHKADPMCPMEEVVRAMSYVIQQGWAMYWGTARWSQVEIMEAYTNCRQFNCITPIVEQSEYHMFCREKCELYLPEMYNKIGVGLMAWGPLSMALSDTQNGDKLFLPKGSFKTKSFSWTEDEINRNAALSPQGSWGKDRIEEGRRHCDRLRDLAALAEKLGCSPTQLSIAWSLKHEPVQCLLLGATSAEQLHQSLQSLQLLPRLSSSVMLELERILENKPVRPPMISTLALR
ncbi:PREDICTED: voltage-gated potassium channel subunit beta-2 isoform X3 [Drosophila arizonae]|uniref:Voltage-gated potassium channel subunit beta-2 isoform X3 n=1 Tax=Drosophila arizonae TaxID=7263 RepID=A0ABM1PTD2_DROAR|nr:PREDICTED: voltage-gated potassium channel subunit beta-2 isoform X3 [Drosophila arizonae]XP_017870469.1 PREDICTED: voltage-gated potassium channel subunit beta-2 isoform X3 [Drosophila arizonae]